MPLTLVGALPRVVWDGAVTPRGSGPPSDPAIVDLTDEQACRTPPLKWGAGAAGRAARVGRRDGLRARAAGARGRHPRCGGRVTGYPGPRPATSAEALAGFAQRQWGWDLDPSRVVLVGDVMAGIGLALDTLCDPGRWSSRPPPTCRSSTSPRLTGRERVDLPLDPDDEHATLDLDRLDALLAAGARTVLLSQPHNPWGRVFTRSELEGLRDVVLRHGARVISDEIHAPLVLDGAAHVPYLSVEGTADHAVTVLAASKAFNTAGLKCAQVVAPGRDDARALSQVPLVPQLRPLAARCGRGARRLHPRRALARRPAPAASTQRDLFAQLLAEHLPLARARRQEATYLAWVDARAYGHADPAERRWVGDVWVNAGPVFGPGNGPRAGQPRHLARSAARDRARLATAWA